ncbi:DUF1128 family protein [Gracilibacillus marinus]|uniref:DUF1128 family protein n=1 Tax=Gracilibacillus marinus TaxID=630535 RepID=A0ABV8VT50_9BACI
MDLSIKNEDNFEFMINEMAKMLNVVNASLLDPKHYKLENYEEIKSLYDLLKMKGGLTVAETNAFIEELKTHRIS